MWDPRGGRIWDPPVPLWDGGAQIGTGGQMRCLGMIQVVAGGPLSSGIVELRPACDKACGFQFLQRSHDRASATAGFGHECADRRIAREIFVGFVGEKVQDELRCR